tara:strand:+ start:39 stop:1019 length:981 start_codon:yes stop_codon:yes gene_type:complete
MSDQVLPWHSSLWESFKARAECGKIPHAILVSGPKDSGKLIFAKAITDYLLCEFKDGPCNDCKSCKLLLAGSHPDYRVITSGDKQLKVDQVRETIDWALKSSVLGGIKFCLFSPADSLNNQAQNALLKVLEEPPPKTFFCLVSGRPTSLLATVKSRCQSIYMNPPTLDEAKSWLSSRNDGLEIELILKLSEQNPLKAHRRITQDFLSERKNVANLIMAILDGSSSPLSAAIQMDVTNPIASFEIWYAILSDAIIIQQVGVDYIKSPDLINTSKQLSSIFRLPILIEILELIYTAISISYGTTNANSTKLIEQLCLSVSGVKKISSL